MTEHSHPLPCGAAQGSVSGGPLPCGAAQGSVSGGPPSEWTGLRGRFHAWFFTTYTRKILEILIFGNYWPAFKKERARRIRSGNEMVLDIGSGSGNFSLPIARRMKEGKVICLDPSTVMTDYLERTADSMSLSRAITILNREASDTGLDDGCIDWIVSGNCLHEMSRPELVMTEMYRVLKPGGTVFLVDFRDWHGFHEGTHGPYSLDQMTEILAKAGFTNVKAEPHRHFVIGTGEKQAPVGIPSRLPSGNDT